MSHNHSPMDVDGERCYESTKRRRGARKKKLLVDQRVEVVPRRNPLFDFCFFHRHNLFSLWISGSSSGDEFCSVLLFLVYRRLYSVCVFMGFVCVSVFFCVLFVYLYDPLMFCCRFFDFDTFTRFYPLQIVGFLVEPSFAVCFEFP